mgnify:FL=1
MTVQLGPGAEVVPDARQQGDDLPMSERAGPEPRAATVASAPAPEAPRNDLARNVVRQMAEAVRQGADGPLEVALQPEELGRVRLSFTGAEGGLTVTVTAERPETLELMRRNADLLARELGALGYADVALDFGASQNRDRGTQGAPETRVAPGPEGEPAPESPPVPHAAPRPGGGLDLRM